MTSKYQRIDMRITVSLDDDVFEAAQTLAASSGKKLGKLLSQLARRGLRVEAATSRRSGLPVFQVGADAPIIPGNRAGELLANDAM